MFIDINTIGSEGLSFDALDPAARPRRAEPGEHPGRRCARSRGTDHPAPGGAELNARLGATVPLTCSRCLETFPWDVRMAFAWTVLRRVPDAAFAGRATCDDEASILVAPEGKIGLEDLATEQLVPQSSAEADLLAVLQGLVPDVRNEQESRQRARASPKRPIRGLAPLLPFRRKLQDS